MAVSVGSGEALDFFFFDGLPPELTAADSSGAGEADAFRLPCGDAVGEDEAFLPDAVGDGVSCFAVVFFFFRAGVGVGVEKIFLSLSPTDCSARTGAAIDIVKAAAINVRKNITDDETQLAGNFLKDCFINPNPGIEILQRKILIR